MNEHVQDILSAKYDGYVCVASDGSKYEDDVGVAVTSDCLEEAYIKKLPKYASVYSAEMFGLLCAVQCLVEQDTRKFVILTDSMSSLISLQSNSIASSTPMLWFKIRNKLKQLWDAGYEVTLLWVPAHKGVTLNEEADKASKEAAIRGHTDPANIYSRDIRLSSSSSGMSKWQEKWNCSDKGRFCHNILSVVSTVPWFSELNFSRRKVVILCKLIANHSRLPSHLYRNGIIDSPECNCGAANASPNHIFFECTQYENSELRQQLWKTVRRRNVPPDIETILKRRNISIMKCLCEFIIANEIDL